MRLPHSLEALARRRFRLLFTGRTISSFGLAAIFGGASAFGRLAYQGLVPQTVPPTQLEEANALMGLSFSVVAIAGPAVGSS